ncbi:MAG: biopolymer transporter ExbD [Cyanobacteria bacterium P01_H01_bin.74]
MQTGKKKQLFNEINITPLTDIFLVLLIIMMVVAPMVDQGRSDIKPPTIESGSSVEPNKVTLELTADGKYYVQGKPVEQKSQLPDALRKEQAELEATTGLKEGTAAAVTPGDGPSGNPEASGAGASIVSKKLIVRADQKTKSGEVIAVFSAAREAGYTSVIISGEPLSQQRQEALKENNQSAS